MVKIVHASDFHFTGPYFQEHLWEEFKRQMDRIQPDILIVTGDITDDGYPHEYTIAQKYLESIPVEKLVVPGNHDARNVGYEAFEEFFGPRWRTWERDGVIILGGDSSEPDIDDGHIGRENYQLMEDVFHREGFKIFALHHHLLPIPGTGRERNIPVDAGDVLKIITDAGVNLVLSGHKHLPWIWRLEDTIFITAGTATTTRLKGRVNPSFIHIKVEGDGSTFAIEKVELPLEKVRTPLLGV